MLDRKVFFDAVRPSLFRGRFSDVQVAGIEHILDNQPDNFRTDYLAYCLATAYHETARTMSAIAEYGHGKGRSYGVPVGPYRQVYYGRGLVQLTWEANYVKATAKLRAAGVIDATIDLDKEPDLALNPDIAAPIMFYGMLEGWFTGKKLSDYFGPSKADPVGARRIINGTDQASTIAGYYKTFYAALLKAAVADAAAPSPVLAAPPAPVAPIVVPATVRVAPPPAFPAPVPVTVGQAVIPPASVPDWLHRVWGSFEASLHQ